VADVFGRQCLQRQGRLRAYQRFVARFPEVFHEELLGDEPPAGEDPFQLALLRHYRSLAPLALEARKPIFDLKAADGAIGSHAATVRDANKAFAELARTIAARAGVQLRPGSSLLDDL
jgi:hypothetical protein